MIKSEIVQRMENEESPPNCTFRKIRNILRRSDVICCPFDGETDVNEEVPPDVEARFFARQPCETEPFIWYILIIYRYVQDQTTESPRRSRTTTRSRSLLTTRLQQTRTEIESDRSQSHHRQSQRVANDSAALENILLVPH